MIDPVLLSIVDAFLSAGIRAWAVSLGREPTEEEIKARIARARAINAIPIEDYERGVVDVPLPVPPPPTRPPTV